MRGSWWTLFPLLIVALPGCARARSESQPPDSTATFASREGSRLFASFCSPCHGEAGRGDGAYLSAGAPATPPDFTATGVRERIRTDGLVTRLSATAASGADHCPPWGNTFSPAEIEALATFVEELARRPPDGGS